MTRRRLLDWIKIGGVIILVTICITGLLNVFFNAGGDNALTADDDSNDGGTNIAEPYSTGQDVSINDLLITFGNDYEIRTIENRFSDRNGEKVVRLPVTWTNNKDDSSIFPLFGLYVYDPSGVEVSSSIGALFDDSTVKAPSILPGVTQQTAMYFMYNGDGSYLIKIDNHKIGESDATIKIEISDKIEHSPVLQENSDVEPATTNYPATSNDAGQTSTQAVSNSTPIQPSVEPQICVYKQMYGDKTPEELAQENSSVQYAKSQLEEAERLQRQYANSTGPEFEQKRVAAEFAVAKAQRLYDEAYAQAVTPYATMRDQCY